MALSRVLKNLVKRIVKDALLFVIYPHEYEKACKQPVVSGKTVFVEVRETSLSDSFKLLHERLNSDYDIEVRVDYLHEYRVSYAQTVRNSIAMLRDIATAQYIFLNDASNVVSCVTLREESKVIQTWHACGAFKKWGMSTADLKFGGSRKQKLRHPFYENLSLVTTSSPEVNWAYIEAMHLERMPEIVKALGVSRTDSFFDPQFIASAREGVERKIPQARGKKIVLYAPTFRGTVAAAQGPDQLDIEQMRRELGDGFVLLVKHHPFVQNPPAIPESCKHFAFNVGDAFAIDKLMCAADMCISDYSSLVFEYSLLSRPIAFFAYDKADYDDWRGFYYDYDQLTPGPVFETTGQVIDWAKASAASFDPSEVNAFRSKFMSSCDGHSTERILKEVFETAPNPVHV